MFKLVMSDEFDVVNRTFADGEDPTWTAGDHSDDARCVCGDLIYVDRRGLACAGVDSL